MQYKLQNCIIDAELNFALIFSMIRWNLEDLVAIFAKLDAANCSKNTPVTLGLHFHIFKISEKSIICSEY